MPLGGLKSPYNCLVFLLWSLCLAYVCCNDIAADDASRSQALDRFFESIDKDGNGQIEVTEASQYIHDNFNERDIRGNPAGAAQQMNMNLDSSDADATVSRVEVERHLRKLLRVPSHIASFRHHIKIFQHYDVNIAE